jgi:hypothetical protein
MTDTKLYRQGDILIMGVDRIPENLTQVKRPILASGDSTGHSHQIRDARAVRLFRNSWMQQNDKLAAIPAEHYLEVLVDETDVVHPEHAKITLPRGCYRVWRQREFGEQGNRVVLD